MKCELFWQCPPPDRITHCNVHRWARCRASRSVVTDPAGNGYYAGDFTGYTEFGGRRLESDGQNDAMFVKFLPGGEIDWARNFGGDGDDLGNGIFADDNGTLFVCGPLNCPVWRIRNG